MNRERSKIEIQTTRESRLLFFSTTGWMKIILFNGLKKVQSLGIAFRDQRTSLDASPHKHFKSLVFRARTNPIFLKQFIVFLFKRNLSVPQIITYDKRTAMINNKK